MAKTIGLSRAIKLEWLNKTVDLVLEGLSPEEIKDELNAYIAYEISSPDNIRKSRDILMNLWVRPFENEAANEIREKALEEIRNGNTDRMAMHWCMLLLYYPVFVDVTGTIGRIAAMQDSFTLAWLKEKIFEQWGERTTLIHSIPKIMQTIRQLGAVESSGNAYTVVRNEIKDDQTKIILVKTILALKMKPYYEPSELTAIPQLFPFTYDLSTDVVFGSGAFEFGNFGGNHVLIS